MIETALVARECCNQQFWFEVSPLFVKHWNELGRHKDQRPLDINRAFYLAADAADKMRWYTLRRGGELLGYACYVLMPGHLHYQTWRYAMADTFFVDPAYGPRVWGYVRLFRFAGANLAAAGCKSIIGHDRGPGLSAVYRRLGYDRIESLYELLL